MELNVNKPFSFHLLLRRMGSSTFIDHWTAWNVKRSLFLFSKGSLIQRDLWQVLWRSCWKNRVSGKLGTSYLSRQVSLLRRNKFLRVERGVTGRTSAGLHCFKGHTRFPAPEVVLQFASSPFSFSFFFSCFFSFYIFNKSLSSHYPLAGVLLLLFFNSIQSESAFILHYKITSECPCFFSSFFSD